MKKNKEKLNHGLHNEMVCDYLDLKREFADWIITTAFYSTLQFETYKIFPIEIPNTKGKREKVENIDMYFRIKNPNHISKHHLLSDLVYQLDEKIADDYVNECPISKLSAGYFCCKQSKIADEEN